MCEMRASFVLIVSIRSVTFLQSSSCWSVFYVYSFAGKSFQLTIPYLSRLTVIEAHFLLLSMNQDLGLSCALPQSIASSSPDTIKKPEEKICLANSLKLEGNNFYNNKNLKEAIRHYHRALLYIKGVESDGSDMLSNLSAAFTAEGGSKNQMKVKIDPSLLEKNRQLKLDCYNNLSACLLQTAQPDFEKVVFYCQEVIKSTPTNPKAHFRMAQALFKLGDFEGALKSCNHSLENQLQEDSKVVSLKKSCLAQLSKQASQEKVVYGKMFGFQQ